MKRGHPRIRQLVAVGVAVTILLLVGVASSTAAEGPGQLGDPADTAVRPDRTSLSDPADDSATGGRANESTSIGSTSAKPDGNFVTDSDPDPSLPACTYGDTTTTYPSSATFDRSLVDTEWRLPRTFAPNDLVEVSRAGLTGGGKVRSILIKDLKAMARAAEAAGARLAVQSAYRSYATQIATFNHWVSVDGYARARRVSARPGHSEHQLGTTIDFKSFGGTAPWLRGDWGTSAAGTWLRTNGWQYGFVMSYPRGKRSLSCYAYEPWHYRYVGPSAAKAIHESGLTSREWLWTQGAISGWVGSRPPSEDSDS